MFNLQFNAKEVTPSMGFEALPSGIYTVHITNSEEKPVLGKPGYYMQFDMTVLEGDQKGKVIADRLNYKNENQQAVDIAYRTLSAICHVTGKTLIGQSSGELHNIPFKINVVKIPRKDDPTKESNEIRGYLDMQGNPPKQGVPAGANGAAPAQAAAFAAPATAPAQVAAPVTQVAPVAPATFPPEGWVAHPQAPGYFYKGQEVLTEAQLREKFAPVAAAPATPAVPVAPAPAANGAPALPSWAT